MNDFDQYIKRKVSEESVDIPESVQQKIEETIAGLPEKSAKHKKVRVFPRIAAAAACFLFVIIFALPNMSVVYAKALEKIPVIGEIVRVVTIRNYTYSDAMHEMNIDVPKVEKEDGEEFDPINEAVKDLTDTLVQRFYEELKTVGDKGHGGIYVYYETVTNTADWFTLKLQVLETAGSSNNYYKYYHVNRQTSQIVCLGDLFEDEKCYAIMKAEIEKQMKAAMAEDSSLIYWTSDSVMGENCLTITGEHNFYWNEEGDLVIPFDKYEVSPGYMGTPEFVIDKDIIKDSMKKEYYEIISDME